MVEVDSADGVFVYHITHHTFSLTVVYLERFSVKEQSLIPSSPNPHDIALHRLLRLKHYRAQSDRWKDRFCCDDCVEHMQAELLPYTVSAAHGLSLIHLFTPTSSLERCCSSIRSWQDSIQLNVTLSTTIIGVQ
jgi:hypothetical protein